MPSLRIGYARTSTIEQLAGLEAQKRDLTAAGAERIFHEQVSSVTERAELDRVLSILREGDELLVTKLDRLARSVRDLMEIVDKVASAGAKLRILNIGLDTTTPTGKLMLGLLGSVAQFEREIMLERQREGIAKAKAEGKYRGRKPLAPETIARVRELHDDARRPADIARKLGISRTSVYKALSLSAEQSTR